MSDKRSYDDPCGLARALDAVGERWALLVVRELLHGPKRFGDLRRGLRGASQNVLSQRLRDLDAAGVVARRRLGPPASTWVYDLTPRGRDLEPVLFQLSRWGSRAPLTSSADLSVDALMLALKTTFDSDRAVGLRLAIELRVGEDRFAARVVDQRLELNRVSSPYRANAVDGARPPLDQRPGHGHTTIDAVIGADVATLRSLVFGGRALDDAVRVADATVVGSLPAAERFIGLFPRPATAG